jgi:hypothetical protein
MKIQDEYKVLSLRGIIYHGNNHFCSRIISVDGTIWYNDITTGKDSIEDGHLSTTRSSLQSSMYSCQNPAESGRFRSFRGNGILAVLSAKIVISVPLESRPEFQFRRNDHRNYQTRIDRNRIRSGL